MKPEDLIKLLQENGLRDEEIYDLLENAIELVKHEEEGFDEGKEEEEKAQAGKLLGVTL